jgi:lysophospholipase L1-like esterase
MNKIITSISILLNFILLFTLLSLTYKMGYLGRAFVAFNANAIDLPTDTLSSQTWWQDDVKYQVIVTQNQQYTACLFGDSISSGLGNTLGDNTFNFAIGGMSTISLIEQLKMLTTAKVGCNKAIIAIGTNDADYRVTNNQVIRNMKDIIATVRQMGANRVILLPAFYSTVAASHDPSMAGPIARVEEINGLIRQVAVTEKVLISGEGIQPLFEGQALKQNLTTDGVHLNADGKKIYREALLKILKVS